MNRPLEEWGHWKLERFSGYVDYQKTVELGHHQGRVILELGEVHHLAHVWINGVDVGSRLWPPFEFEITRYLQTGSNTVRVRVGNLTNNNYGQNVKSGLFGPVRIILEEPGEARSNPPTGSWIDLARLESHR